ncbi:MAG: choice-of-anchor J domain-containing protein [Chlamydiota bacterium]
MKRTAGIPAALAAVAFSGGVARAVQLSNVPYVHQVYDTPSAFDGSWACNATSALMAIQYYGRLPVHQISLPAFNGVPAHTSDYGFYVSEQYTYNGVTYSVTFNDASGNPAKGGYGYVHRLGDGWGQNLRNGMRDWIGNHNLASSELSATTAAAKAQIDASHPFSLLNSLTDAGHYITVIGYENNGETVIVNDPFGNKATGYGTYGNMDGAGVRYDWPGTNHGHPNLNSVWCILTAEGAAAEPTATPVVQPTPTRTPTPSGPTPTPPPGALLNESFEGAFPPAGWTQSGCEQSSAQTRTGNYSVKFNLGTDSLITPLLPNPGTLTYWMYATAGASEFHVSYSSSVSGPWTELPGSPTTTDYAGTFKQETFDLSNYADIYIQFQRGGSRVYYLDDVVVTANPAGTPTPTKTPVPPTRTPTRTPTPAAPTPTPLPDALLSESFEGAYPPTNWLQYTTDWSIIYTHSATHSVMFNAGGDYLITPLLTCPGTLTYWMRATAGASSFNVQYSSSTSGPWTHLAGSPTGTDYAATFMQQSFDLSGYTDIYIRFSRGDTKTYYLDDVVVTWGTCATPTITPPVTATPIWINYQPEGGTMPSGNWLTDWGTGNDGEPDVVFGWLL